MALHSTIQQRMDQAAARWRWLRFLEYSAMLGIIVTGVVLVLGAVGACGGPAHKSVALLCLVLFPVGAVLMLALWSLVIAMSRPEQGRLARAIERAHPILMDRLNTLVFLRSQKDTAWARSFYRRVEAQASSALAGQSPGRLFSPRRAAIRFCVLVAMILLTIVFYVQFTPLAAPAPATANAQSDGEQLLLEKPFEMPAAVPEPAEESARWGAVRITRPGRDLVVTRVEDVGLEIEASASEPVRSVGWQTAINGGEATEHKLPRPADPNYAVYELVIELEKFGLSDWDVLSYSASMVTEEGDSHVSEIYFIEVRPFRTELSELPDGGEGKCYSVLNKLTGLIERQQEVLRDTHRQLHFPESTSELRRHEREQLAAAENSLATTTAHLAAGIASEFGRAAVLEPVSHLGRAEESLRGAAGAFGERVGEGARLLAKAQPEARKALAELVAARKGFQECFAENPSAFTPAEAGEDAPVSEPAEILRAVSEFSDKAETAAEFVRELAERQRQIAKGIQLGKVKYKATFTSGLDGRNRPVDSIDEISLSEKRIYMHTSWRGFSRDEHEQVFKMFDGSGKMVEQDEISFTPSSDVWNIWNWRDFDQSKDQPGTWRFEAYIDGQKMIEKNLEVRSADEAGGGESVRQEAAESFRSLDQKELFRRLAEAEDVLGGEFAEFEKEYPDICRSVQKECTAARDGLGEASDALHRRHGEAHRSTTQAAEELDRLAEALDKQTLHQQMANAYRLKSALDEQINLLKRLEQEPEAMGAEEVQEACQNMKEVTDGLKRIAENEPTSEFFGQELRDALNDENKRELDSQCDSLCSAQGDGAKKSAAQAARSGLEKVSAAFAASQPQLLAELREKDAFKPGGQLSLERGIKNLESLVESGRNGRRLSAEEGKQLEQEARTNIEEGVEDMDSDRGSNGEVLRALREFYAPEVTIDPKVLQQLIGQLKNLRAEFVAEGATERGEPEIRHIDPANLPPAYRERIQKYFEGLSEQ